MKIISRRTCFGAGLAFVLALPAAAQVLDITGAYRAEGRNPDGSTYTGRAAVAQQGSAVEINWSVAGQTYAGSGIRTGQVVVINWGQPDPVIYVVMNNGQLHGTWAAGTALERLLPQ